MVATAPATTFRDATARTIAGLRASRGWSLRVLSERTGISTPYLSEIERGRKEASGATLEQLSRAFDMTLAEMLRAIAEQAEQAREAEAGSSHRHRLQRALAELGEAELRELAGFADYLRWRSEKPDSG